LKKEIISVNEYFDLISDLIFVLKNIDFDLIYGIPRGGLPIAVWLSHRLNKPMTTNLNEIPKEFRSAEDFTDLLVREDNHNSKRLLIVDDIVDTGITLEKIEKELKPQKINYLTASLHYKPTKSKIKPNIFIQETNKWIVYPYEPIDELPSDYHEELYPEIVGDIYP
jgi:hypoxanthine phosphoribosyltransferase